MKYLAILLTTISIAFGQTGRKTSELDVERSLQAGDTVIGTSADKDNFRATLGDDIVALQVAIAAAAQVADVDALTAALAALQAELDAHEAQADNPHAVTAAQVGGETVAQLNVRDDANRDRTNHTGEQDQDTVTGLPEALLSKADVSALAASDGWGQIGATGGVTLDVKIAELIAASASGFTSYATKALLDADTGQSNGTIAYVYADGTATNNGFWQWDGAAWTVSEVMANTVNVELERALASVADLPEYRNLAEHYDYLEGSPSYRSGSVTVDLTTQTQLTNLGFTKGVKWRTGNDYIRQDIGENIDGEYFFGAYLAYSETASNITQLVTASAFSESSGGTLAGLTGQSGGRIDISSELAIPYTTGLINDADAERYLLGSVQTPTADSLFVTGWTIYRSDTPIDTTQALRQMYTELLLRPMVKRYADSVDPTTYLEPRSTLTLGGPGPVDSSISVVNSNFTVDRVFRPFPTKALNNSPVFNWRQDIVDGVTIRTLGDDNAPFRALGTTIGGNHGYVMTEATAVGHGKTAADVGQILAISGIEHVIIQVIDTDSLFLAHRTINTTSPTGNYDYVSGGSDTGGLIVASAVSATWYPHYASRSIELLVDGQLVTSTVGEFRYLDNVTFIERYEIPTRSALVSWHIANGDGDPDPAPAILTSNQYVFDHEGQCSTYSEFIATTSVALTDIMFLQANKMNGSDGTTRYYIPKTLPLTHNSLPYDYAMIDSTDTSGWGGQRLDFTIARCEPTGILADRVVMLGDAYGYAVGYLPLFTAGVAERRVQVTEKALH
jgi:hypothetical protein